METKFIVSSIIVIHNVNIVTKSLLFQSLFLFFIFDLIQLPGTMERCNSTGIVAIPSKINSNCKYTPESRFNQSTLSCTVSLDNMANTSSLNSELSFHSAIDRHTVSVATPSLPGGHFK